MWKPRWARGQGSHFSDGRTWTRDHSTTHFGGDQTMQIYGNFQGFHPYFPLFYWGLVWVGKIITACGTNGTTASEAERAHEAFERLRLEAEDNISAGVRRSRTGNQ